MKITIITVVLNHKNTIADAIKSVANQTYKNIEHIIIDGGSTDGTIEVIKGFEGQISHFESASDDGIYDAMNKGVRLANGEVIGFLNADDFYIDGQVIEKVAQKFTDNPDTAMVLGSVDFVRSDNLTKPVRFYSVSNFAAWKIRFGFMPPHPASFIKKSAYAEAGFYELDYKIASDFELFVRMLLRYKMTYAKIGETLVRMRLGGVSTSGIISTKIITKEMIRACRDNGIYTNILLVIWRLPIKFITSTMRRFYG